jgi:hypothetical protein
MQSGYKVYNSKGESNNLLFVGGLPQFGGIAQLVERLLCKQDVRSSSLLTSIKNNVIPIALKIHWASTFVFLSETDTKKIVALLVQLYQERQSVIFPDTPHTQSPKSYHSSTSGHSPNSPSGSVAPQKSASIR